MALTLKKADGAELEAINALVVESEMASTGKENDKASFMKAYGIGKNALLMNDSFVFYEDRKLVGFFMIRNEGAEHELEYFYIAHGQLGKGYGRLLWKHVDDFCIKNNIHKLNIVCGKNVTAFYLSMGAKKLSETDSKVYSGTKIDLLQYEVDNHSRIEAAVKLPT